MGTYIERYVYDAAGNLLEMQHRGSDPAHPGWTRTYTYNEPSRIEPAKQSNRLTGTVIGGTTETYSTAGNEYDAHGNMLRMPHLQVMQWDFKDQLRMTQRQAVNAADADGAQRHGERTWYVYDSGGQRIRKVTELATGQLKDEHIYLGVLEISRRNGANPLVRKTLHIMDDQQRIALVETRTQGNEPGVPPQLIRYQLGNHLGSASLELDHQAQIISYEEYSPYGSTTYQAVRSQTETPKRYRYTGKERDEESGLYYHGARYYAPWLGRWTRTDPIGIADGTNVYAYVRNNPVLLLDKSGKNGIRPEDIISDTTAPAGNRTFYYVVDWRREAPEVEGYSAVGNQMAAIQREGMRGTPSGSRGQFGAGVYTFAEEHQAQGLAGGARPYAAFQVEPSTPVRQITVRLAGGGTNTYTIVAPGSTENLRTTSLEFRNVSPQQAATYREALAGAAPVTIRGRGGSSGGSTGGSGSGSPSSSSGGSPPPEDDGSPGSTARSGGSSTGSSRSSGGAPSSSRSRARSSSGGGTPRTGRGGGSASTPRTGGGSPASPRGGVGPVGGGGGAGRSRDDCSECDAGIGAWCCRSGSGSQRRRSLCKRSRVHGSRGGFRDERGGCSCSRRWSAGGGCGREPCRSRRQRIGSQRGSG